MPALPAARKSSVLGPEADLCDEIYANEGIRDFIADGKGFKRALGTVITISPISRVSREIDESREIYGDEHPNDALSCAGRRPLGVR